MKILLGMSGGVDSTMCALMLLEQGHEVIGVTMAKWSPSSGINCSDKRGCFGPSEPQVVAAAVKLAKELGIEHHVIDLELEFAETVLDYYVRTYLKGNTPNPCIVCNKHIKFGALLQKSRALGIDFDRFATGHYARICYDNISSRWLLKKAADSSKDQSYFLSMLSQEQLSQTLFPLGEMKKSQIKDFAKSKGYSYLVKKKESQDFLESIDNSSLFADYLVEPGNFVDQDMNILGRHRGIIHYTIGQRKGLGLAGFSEAQYVIGLDAENNRVIIGPKSALYKDSLKTIGVNWISIPEPQSSFECSAKIRLAQDPQPCQVHMMADNSYYVKFKQPISAITPGQVIAFYHDDLVLGAGFIA